jgi:hypothetical protein
MIQATEARKHAFQAVGKTYGEAVEITMDFIGAKIETAAKHGNLSYSIDEDWLLIEFKPFNLGRHERSTVLELIKSKLESIGYKIIISQWNYSPTRSIEIIW